MYSYKKVFRPKIVDTIKNYNKELFYKDLMAGLIVGIVAIPLAIAFGIASGVTPEKGLITAIIAGFLVSLFGGSKVQIGGPTGAFIVIIYGIIQQYGTTGLITATLMAGVILVLMGVFKLGSVIKFVPYPVIVGFTAGIAVTIFSTQIKDFFGLSMEAVPAGFIEKWIAYFQSFSTVHLWTLSVAIISFLIIVFTPKVSKKVPGSLMAIIVVTIAVYLLKTFAGIDGIETIGDRFSINASIPEPSTPEFSFETIERLLPVAFTIAMLGAIESLLSAMVADGVIGDRHDSNTELIAQGIANIVVPIFGGIPATGAIARTMTNINNGGRSPIAGIIHAIVLLLVLLFLGDLAGYIPMSCLAAVLVMVSYNMSGWKTFRSLMKNPKSDIAVLLTTFFLTVIFDLTIAIEIGLLLAVVLFLKRTNEVSSIRVFKGELDPKHSLDIHLNEEKLIIPKGVEVYEIDGPYFFGVANKFDEIMGQIGEKPKVRVLRMRKVPFIDSTGLHNLENLCINSRKDGIPIILSGVNQHVSATLQKAGFGNVLPHEFIFSHIDEALVKAQDLVHLHE